MSNTIPLKEKTDLEKQAEENQKKKDKQAEERKKRNESVLTGYNIKRVNNNPNK